MGLSNPLPWLMSRPAVYEAAITAGQFFLISGIYSILVLARRPRSATWSFLIPDICLAFAVGSRLTLLPAAIVLLSGFIFLRKRFERRLSESGTDNLWFEALIVFTPLILGVSGLAIYNHARFGSIFEFGHRYQLTVESIAGDYAPSFSSSNILPNLYNYFVNPFRRLEIFPFVKPPWAKYSIPILRAKAAGSFHAEQITGMLVSVPFVLFGAAPLLVWGRSIWKQLDVKRLRQVQILEIIPGSWGWLYFTLLITSALLLLPLLVLSYSTMRYLLDFFPTLLILGSIGFAFCLQEFGRTRLARIGLILSGISTASYSATIDVLLGVIGYFANFEHFNPELFDRISRFLVF